MTPRYSQVIVVIRIPVSIQQRYNVYHVLDGYVSAIVSLLGKSLEESMYLPALHSISLSLVRRKICNDKKTQVFELS